MASLKLKIDTKGLSNLEKRMPSLEIKKGITKKVAFDVIHLMTQRIHIRGEKADGSTIGPYSKKYLEGAREKANRTEKSIVFALTSQLERSWTIVATERGYGIGFQGRRLDGKISNAELAAILKTKYPGVFVLSDSERKFAVDYIKDLYIEALRK